jgi:uric acid transporter
MEREKEARAVVGGLRADTLSSAVAGGLLNGFPASAFAQNVGLVAITGIRSRFVVATSGLILPALGLVPKFGGVIAAIPLPVLGGAGLALFGTVAASGIRALSRVHYEGNANLVIVAVSVAMGVIPIAVPDFYEEFPSWFQTIFESGISAAAVTAVLLNILFNMTRRPIEEAEGPIFAEAPPVGVTPEYDMPGGPEEESHETAAYQEQQERQRRPEH